MIMHGNAIKFNKSLSFLTVETPSLETPVSESPMGLYNRKEDIVRARSDSKEEFRNIPRMNQVGSYTK